MSHAICLAHLWSPRAAERRRPGQFKFPGKHSFGSCHSYIGGQCTFYDFPAAGKLWGCIQNETLFRR